MAKALEGSTKDPIELPNQHSNNQTDTPGIPTPRNGHVVDGQHETQLFLTAITEEEMHDANQYIEDSLKNVDTLRMGLFITGLLERLHTIPSEVSAEEADKRAAAMATIRQILIEYEAFVHPSGRGYDTARFSDEVTDRIGEETIDQYPIIALLSEAVQRIRTIGNRYAESYLVSAQRISLLGIAKQRGVYNGWNNT